MTQEQKAKAYDKAIEGIQEILSSGEDSIKMSRLKLRLQGIFPKLKESEEERIRKGILSGLKYLETELGWDAVGDVDILDAYAWFENQNHDGKKWIYEDVYLKEKEQLIQDGIDEVLENPQKYGLEKQGTSYTKRDVDDAYLKGVTDTKNEIEKQYEANYQIRKNIATFIFNYRGDIKDRAKWMDYLGIKVSFVKGQGEQETLCDKCRKEQPSQSCQDITALGRCAVEHEQKPVDKVEPKFHEGDWLVDNEDCDFFKVIKVRDNTYRIVSQEGEGFDIQKSVVEHDYHKFTINDARDGDVLVDVYGNIGIYEKCDDFDWTSYCSLGHNGGFQHFKIEHENEKTYPAIKEQKNLLFSKMKENGWYWNPETKELSQLEVTKKSDGWSEEDEEQLNCIIKEIESELKKPYFKGYDLICNKKISWLKSLKQRLQ